MYQQVIKPNPNIACIPDMCLEYVQDTFGIGARYGSAIEAWNASPYQHQDRNFPAGMWVPVWFSLSLNENGHVALLAPDGSVYSSSDPDSHVPHHHPSLDALIAYYQMVNPLTYLGWTEDVEGILVIQEEDMVNDELATLAWVYMMDMSSNDAGFAGFRDYWRGKRTADMLRWLADTPRHVDMVMKSREYGDPTAAQKTIDAIKKLVNQ